MADALSDKPSKPVQPVKEEAVTDVSETPKEQPVEYTSKGPMRMDEDILKRFRQEEPKLSSVKFVFEDVTTHIRYIDKVHTKNSISFKIPKQYSCVSITSDTIFLLEDPDNVGLTKVRNNIDSIDFGDGYDIIVLTIEDDE